MITLYLWNGKTGWSSISGTTTVSSEQKTYRREEILLFVQYERGDEAYLEMTFKFIDNDIGTEFEFAKLENSIVRPYVVILDESANRVIPIPVVTCVEYLKVEANLVGASTSEGVVNIWIKPNYYTF